MKTIKNVKRPSCTLVLIKKYIRTWASSSFWKLLTPLIKLVAREKNVTITCSRGDGGGAQWHARLSTMAFCHAFGLTYIHSKIEELQPKNLPELRKKWNDMIEISPRVQSLIETKKIRVTSPVELVTKIFFQLFRRIPVTIQVQHCHFYTDFFPEAIENALDNLDF